MATLIVTAALVPWLIVLALFALDVIDFHR